VSLFVRLASEASDYEARASSYGVRQTRQNGEVTGFEIEGVSDALCERFSKQREEIERETKSSR
jgi:hypothetical protein